LAGEGKLSIRSAAKLIPPKRPPSSRKRKAAAAPPEGWTMEGELKNWAPDEVLTALKVAWARDPDRLSKLYDLLEAPLTAPSGDETAPAEGHEPVAANA
jgi:hypothetical protein